MKRIKDVIALIAYPNPFLSPLSHYLTDLRKEQVSEKLNKYILGALIIYVAYWFYRISKFTELECIAKVL